MALVMVDVVAIVGYNSLPSFALIASLSEMSLRHGPSFIRIKMKHCSA